MINHSCPAVVIAKKLAGTIRATRDPMLLDYARENIGTGVERSQHMAVLKDFTITWSTTNSGAPSISSQPQGQTVFWGNDATAMRTGF